MNFTDWLLAYLDVVVTIFLIMEYNYMRTHQ